MDPYQSISHLPDFPAWNERWSAVGIVSKRVERSGRQGTAEEVIEAIFQTHLVMTVDQELFRDILVPIYGTTDWPSTNELIDRFTAYATNKEVISNVANNGMDNHLPAFAARCTDSGPRICFNCGQQGHIAASSTQPAARCGIFGQHDYEQGARTSARILPA